MPIGFFGLFALIPLFVGAMFVFVIGTFIFVAVKGVAQWSYNNSQPVLSEHARVTGKRSETRRTADTTTYIPTGPNSPPMMSTTPGHNWTTCYATFELPSGERREFPLRGNEYGLLAEGDAGILTFQGTRYCGFERDLGR